MPQPPTRGSPTTITKSAERQPAQNHSPIPILHNFPTVFNRYMTLHDIFPEPLHVCVYAPVACRWVEFRCPYCNLAVATPVRFQGAQCVWTLLCRSSAGQRVALAVTEQLGNNSSHFYIETREIALRLLDDITRSVKVGIQDYYRTINADVVLQRHPQLNTLHQVSLLLLVLPSSLPFSLAGTLSVPDSHPGFLAAGCALNGSLACSLLPLPTQQCASRLPHPHRVQHATMLYATASHVIAGWRHFSQPTRPGRRFKAGGQRANQAVAQCGGPRGVGGGRSEAKKVFVPKISLNFQPP